VIPKKPIPGKCIHRVPNPGTTVFSHQCRFDAKPGSPYCGIHSPEAEARRDAKREAQFKVRQSRDPLRIALARIRKLETEVTRLRAVIRRNELL
jgi:hypothetical protein